MDELNNSGYSLEEISPPLTKLEADKLLEEVYQLDKQIKAREDERERLHQRYLQRHSHFRRRQCEHIQQGFLQ